MNFAAIVGPLTNNSIHLIQRRKIIQNPNITVLPQTRESFQAGLQLYEESIAGKWLANLKEIAPGMTRVALLFNPATASNAYLRAAQVIAPLHGRLPAGARELSRLLTNA